MSGEQEPRILPYTVDSVDHVDHISSGTRDQVGPRLELHKHILKQILAAKKFLSGDKDATVCLSIVISCETT